MDITLFLILEEKETEDHRNPQKISGTETQIFLFEVKSPP